MDEKWLSRWTEMGKNGRIDMVQMDENGKKRDDGLKWERMDESMVQMDENGRKMAESCGNGRSMKRIGWRRWLQTK